jgi:magnesium chelatase subunit I
VLVVASANPEDYTRRGRIITPLKDRYQAQIRSHYPKTRNLEIDVMEQERRQPRKEVARLHTPSYMRQIVAEMTMQARQSPDISQVSGVSVRASIANFETLIAAAERRALRLGERDAVPRLTDLPALAWAMGGKIELEYAGTEKSEAEIVDKLTQRAVKIVFDELFDVQDLEPVISAFEEGWKVEVGDLLPSSEYAEGVDSIPGLRTAVEKLGEVGAPARIASAIEFILEGLHLSNRLNKETQRGRILYG